MLLFTRKLLQESLSGQKTFKEELTDLLFSVTDVVYQNSDICELLIHQHAEHFKSLSDEVKQKLKEIHDNNHIILNERIQQAIDTGEIKKIEPEMKAIMVTGYSPDDYISKRIAENDIPFVQKPFDPVDIISIINKYIKTIYKFVTTF